MRSIRKYLLICLTIAFILSLNGLSMDDKNELWAQITRDYGELIELQVYQEKLEQEIAKR